MFKVKEIQLLGLEDAQKSVFIDFQTLNHVFGDAKSDSAVSLVLFDTDNFARQLQQIHGVKKAQVAKEWPHKLIVMIDPKTPIAKANGNLIDENGDILGAWQESLGAFPEFEVSEDAKTDVLALLKMIVKHPAFSQGLTKISATGRDSIAVQRADGLIVVFGNTNDLTLKLESLQIALTQDLQGKRIIDLSAPRDPVAKQ
jgi:cell division septal protein FtsQ